MCCKWLSCQWRSHASMARVKTVRWGRVPKSEDEEEEEEERQGKGRGNCAVILNASSESEAPGGLSVRGKR